MHGYRLLLDLLTSLC